MKLEVDCTWNDKQKKGKVVIVFDNLPKTLFQMKENDIHSLKVLEDNCLLEGPKILEKFKKIFQVNSKSLYAAMAYFQALRSFEFFDEAKALFYEIKKSFPNEISTLCIEGHYLLEEGKEKAFLKLLGQEEVLKGAFPKRQFYHYKEALFL